MHARQFIIALVQASLLLLAEIFQAQAQTNFVLHTFALSQSTGGGVLAVSTNSDGVNPSGWLALSGKTMYGTAIRGGTKGYGTLFAINTNGTFSLLYNFDASGSPALANPNGGLVVSNGMLYGTTAAGGTSGKGTIFSITTNGTSATKLHEFAGLDPTTGTNSDGANPSAGLIRSGSKLFGTASDGGNFGSGVVFSLSGTTLTVLHHFAYDDYNDSGYLTNSDGASPSCQLVLSGTNLFGTTSVGGTNGLGTVFRVSTNGSGFAVLHQFDNDGAEPNAGLVLSGGMLFGISGSIVYSLGTDGAGFTILQQFGDVVDNNPTAATSGLTVSNATLYGVASTVGTTGKGQVFSLNTNGAGFSDFHDFSAVPYNPPQTNSDGAFPSGGIVLLNNSLYGAAGQGGTNGNGVLFRTTPPSPMLACQVSNRNFLLSFPTFGGMSCTVQQNTNLAGTNWMAFTNIMGSGGVTQFTVPTTNLSQLFFRASLP